MATQQGKTRHEKNDEDAVCITLFDILIEDDPAISSSSSSEIGNTIKDSILTGNIGTEVGCTTDETTRTAGKEKPKLKASQRKRGNKPTIRRKGKFKGMRSHKCPYCEKKYTTSNAKSYHVKNYHTNKQTYPCVTCGKKFETKQNLNYHQRVHSPDRPFPCSICHYRFKANSSLERHINHHIKRAQLPESIQPLENLQPVADKSISSLTGEGHLTEASGRITSNQISSLTKVDDNRASGSHPVGNNDTMTSSNESNEKSIHHNNMSITDNSISFNMEGKDDEAVELENGINSNPGTTSVFRSGEKSDKELSQDGKTEVQKGIRKPRKKRRARKPFSAPSFTGGKRCNYKCPHCTKRFASSGKMDFHVKQIHSQTPSVLECKPVEETNDPSSSKKVLFQAGISNLIPSTAQAFSDKRDNLTNSPPAKSGHRTKSQTWKKSKGRKNFPIQVPQTLSSTGKNKCEKCEKTFSTMHTLKNHQKLHSEVFPFECSSCDKKFPRKDYYENHLKTKQHLELDARKEIITTCPRDQTEPQRQVVSSISEEESTEDITMSSSAAGNNNVTFNSTAKRVGDIDYPLACGECNAGFVNHVELVFHVQNSHPDKRFDCQLCSNRGLFLLEYHKCLRSHFPS